MRSILFLIVLFTIVVSSFTIKENKSINSNISNINNINNINPWIFQDRDLLYQYLLNGTHIPLLFGDDNLNNCLWGLRLQFHWQLNSGRLQVTNTTSSIVINQQSWWADMNYFLSVIPYLAAMKLNLVPEVNILPPSNPAIANNICTTFESCNQTMMNNWYQFFETIVAHQNGSNITTDQELLEIMWVAHTGSIHEALNRFNAELKLFTTAEAKFGFGWANFVEVISIVNFNTNYTQVTTLSADLPNRMIKNSDFPPFISNMTKDMNNIIMAINSIADLAKTPLWNPFLDTLRLICKNPNCRAIIDDKIQQFVNSPVPTIIDILLKVITSCK